ncbi:MAG: prepilin peptidase [Candidatus Pacebacteria bacterium]|nr:prepilin peptidase [Candidatus Paceibacterota bacterium]
MDYLALFFIFILGSVVGSFLNVVIFRLGTDDKIVNSRSKCLACSHQLAWYDLFPVFSFLSLGGKCRYCKAKISWQYPLVEIATGILFATLFFQIFQNYDFIFSNFISYFFLIFIFSALIVIFVFDLRHYIIPDEVIYPAIIISFLLVLLKSFLAGGTFNYLFFMNFLASAFLAGGFFMFLVIITKGKGMGGGDIKLGFLMGLVLGLPNILLALFLAFISGALVGVFLIALGRKKMKSMLPFGPFLIFGFSVSYFWGSKIIGWYWGSFLF